jgi:hypothetical protein
MKRVHIPLLLMLSIVLVSIPYPVMSADAKKVIVQNITLNVTVIIPITVVAQNAQICISLASSGNQTCQQIVLDPTQTSYTAVDVDLTQPEPVITTSLSNQTATNSSTNDTSSSTNDTSSFAGKSNRTFEAGKSNITNPSDDHVSKNNAHDMGTDSAAIDKQNVKEDKDKDTSEQEQEEPTQEDGTTTSGDTDEP